MVKKQQKTNTIIVNLLGGAGSGKSTMASGLFYRLKTYGFNVELVTEYAKQKTWEKNTTSLAHQFYVSAKQKYAQDILLGQVDVIITDSPILLGLMYYNEKNDSIKTAFERFIIESFKAQNNINVFVERKRAYNPSGRNQTEDEAKDIDKKIISMLNDNDIDFIKLSGNEMGLNKIYEIIVEEVHNA